MLVCVPRTHIKIALYLFFEPSSARRSTYIILYSLFSIHYSLFIKTSPRTLIICRRRQRVRGDFYNSVCIRMLLRVLM